MKHKILCIDDESHNLEALERLLRKDYQVITSSSGQEGLLELEKHSFSVIISDQKMPHMTGVQFFDQAKVKQPEATRILLTGYTDLESVISAINQGQIYRYTTKPWDPNEFLTLIRQASEIAELKQTVFQQNQDLLKANQQLESLDQLKTEFMFLVNHELKTPLTGLFSFLQLLKEEQLTEAQNLYLTKMEANTKRLQGLIEDTLIITRLKAGHNTNDKITFDIHETIQTLWHEINTNFQQKNLTLKINTHSKFPVHANKESIEIIFKKLLHNSFLYAKSDTEVTFDLNQDQESWSVVAQNQTDQSFDNNIEELTKPFYKNEKMLNHTAGSGLGLAVTQSILQLFAGELRVHSSKGVFRAEVKVPIKK